MREVELGVRRGRFGIAAGLQVAELGLASPLRVGRDGRDEQDGNDELQRVAGHAGFLCLLGAVSAPGILWRMALPWFPNTEIAECSDSRGRVWLHRGARIARRSIAELGVQLK
jgi:hypothetical protein